MNWFWPKESTCKVGRKSKFTQFESQFCEISYRLHKSINFIELVLTLFYFCFLLLSIELSDCSELCPPSCFHSLPLACIGNRSPCKKKLSEDCEEFYLLQVSFFWSPLVRRHLFWPPSMQRYRKRLFRSAIFGRFRDKHSFIHSIGVLD